MEFALGALIAIILILACTRIAEVAVTRQDQPMRRLLTLAITSGLLIAILGISFGVILLIME